MILQLPSSDPTLTERDKETILVDVEELLLQTSENTAPTNVSSKLSLLTSHSPETELPTLLYPVLTTYIKSFSHDSDTSNNTQTSLHTISSQEPGHMDDWDEQEEEEFSSMQFFPSHDIFTEPLEIGGKLTLDAVKIDCSDFFQNAECD